MLYIIKIKHKTGTVLVSLVFVVLVVGHIAVPKHGPLDENSHSTPAHQNDGQLKKVQFAPEVSHPLLLH